MRNSPIVVGLTNLVKTTERPHSTQREAPALQSAAVATGVFMSLDKRCLQWKERKTLPATFSIDTAGWNFWHSSFL